jgi:hypothetical protein
MNILNHKKEAIIFSTLLTILISILTVGILDFNKKEVIKQTVILNKQKQDMENQIVVIIKKYIMDNSDRISDKMANEISQVVIKKKMPIVLLAIMKIESSFNPTALSSQGALGLGQVMPVHVKDLISLKYINSSRDLFDIEANINSAEYLWILMWNKNQGDIIKTLTSYYGANDSAYQNKFFKEYFKVKYLLQDYLICEQIKSN